MDAKAGEAWFIVGDDEVSSIPFIDVSAELPDGCSEPVADVRPDQVGDEFVITDRTRARASLIAASPDLLAALRECQSLLHDLVHSNLPHGITTLYARGIQAETRARAAIAKAESGR